MKQFSINEAERLIPILSPLVLRAQQLKKQLEAYEEMTLRRRVTTDGAYELETLDTEHTMLKESFYTLVEQITAHECIVRDVEEGLIDFPARFEGRDVFLSWRLGERRVHYWHEKNGTLVKTSHGGAYIELTSSPTSYVAPVKKEEFGDNGPSTTITLVIARKRRNKLQIKCFVIL